MSSREADEIEFNLGPRVAVESDRLEPDLEDTSADDTRSTVELKAVADQPASEEENYEKYREELETLLDPPTKGGSNGGNSRAAPISVSPDMLLRLLTTVNELKANQASPSAPPPVVKSEPRLCSKEQSSPIAITVRVVLKDRKERL